MSAKTVVFAYHDIGCAGIEALLDSGYDIAAVFTHADDPKENAFYASVAQLCASKGIPVHAPEDANHPLWIERIAKLNPEYIFSFYYRNLLSEALLATAKKARSTCTARCCHTTAVAHRRTGCWSTVKPKPALPCTAWSNALMPAPLWPSNA